MTKKIRTRLVGAIALAATALSGCATTGGYDEPYTGRLVGNIGGNPSSTVGYADGSPR